MKIPVALASLGLGLLLLGGCTAPISAERVTTRQAYSQVEANAIRSGKPSAATASILHRFDLDSLAAKHPEEAVRKLHQKALASGERDLLFALSELSYVAGRRVSQSVKPWDRRDPRDYYLGSAVYAWLFLFSETADPERNAFDRRFRLACDLYNASLGLAFTEQKGTNGLVRLVEGRRALPVGAIEVRLAPKSFDQPIEGFERIVLADELRVRGLSVRSREPGLGTPLVCVSPVNTLYGLHPSEPATMLLRGPGSLASAASGTNTLELEIYSSMDDASIQVGNAQVPLEIDLTAHSAYTLNQSRIWKLGSLGFLAPAERIPSQLIASQSFQTDRIPVVFVHGTFSSPVTWAEMANTLAADPALRKRYQIWLFIYGSGNPLAQSMTDLRAALSEKIQELDPQNTNSLLRQMVVVGHSQGGLLTKATAVDTGDKLWKVFSDKDIESLSISNDDKVMLRESLFLTPLPFVKRVVFIATPHRGSYLASSLARRLAQRLVNLPGAMVTRTKDVFAVMGGSEASKFLRGRLPTSLDGMSPKNPSLAVLSEIPVAAGIKSHSIIPVQGSGDYHSGKDGLVSYESAHQEGTDSEFIVRSHHSCLNQPATIEEVRRILRLHLDQVSEASKKSGT